MEPGGVAREKPKSHQMLPGLMRRCSESEGGRARQTRTVSRVGNVRIPDADRRALWLCEGEVRIVAVGTSSSGKDEGRFWKHGCLPS